MKPIKITAGPTIKKFCDCFGVEEEEAVQWVHSYVNRPSDWDMLTGLYEATPSLRYESIKHYIQSQIDGSVTMRIKNSLQDMRDEQISA